MKICFIQVKNFLFVYKTGILLSDMKSGFIYLLFMVALFTQCTPRRSETKILYYTDKAEIPVQDHLGQIIQASGMKMVMPVEFGLLQEDSLKQISSIITTFSALSQMGHRDLTIIKRYLEAGGGGIVAIKDTPMEKRGWPWLISWNSLPPNKAHKQDKGSLFILENDYQKKDLTTALEKAIGGNLYPDFSKATSLMVPDSNRYTYQVLSQGLDEPMQMAILPDNNVLFVERKGSVKLYDANTKETK